MAFSAFNPRDWDNTSEHLKSFNREFSFSMSPPSGLTPLSGGFSTGLDKGIPITTNNNFVNEPIEGKVMVQPLMDNMQQYFEEGDYIFCCNPDFDSSERYPFRTIWSINYYLEYAERTRQQTGSGVASAFGKRKVAAETDVERDFPSDLEKMLRVWREAGFISVNNAKDNANSVNKMFSVSYGGRCPRPGNIWGDIRKGDYVGIVLKKVAGYYDAFYDMNGNKTDHPTTGSFLQIIPVFSRETRIPPHCSSYLKPSTATDTCFIDNTLIQQKHFNRRGSVIDFESGAREQRNILNISEIKEGKYIEIGFVKKTPNPTSETQCKMGIRSHLHYKELMKVAPVELEMTLNGAIPTY